MNDRCSATETIGLFEDQLKRDVQTVIADQWFQCWRSGRLNLVANNKRSSAESLALSLHFYLRDEAAAFAHVNSCDGRGRSCRPDWDGPPGEDWAGLGRDTAGSRTFQMSGLCFKNRAVVQRVITIP